MRKITLLVALFFISAITFAQVTKHGNSTIKSVKIVKQIDNSVKSNAKTVLDSLHYDGDNAGNSIGTGSAATFGVFAFFPQDSLASHVAASHVILSEKLYINGVSDVASAELQFYTDTLLTALVYSQPFTPVEGWNNVLLTTPFPIPATGNLYIGYEITATGGYPAGCDEGPVNLNGNWINMGSWAHLNDLSSTLVGTWNIRAMCGTAPTTPEVSCTPLTWDAGVVPTGSSLVSGTFTLTNVGVGTLTCSGITGLSAPFTTNFTPASVSLTAGQSSTFTFTFAPTTATPVSQTVTIATNAGNVNIALTGSGIDCNTITTFPWSEGFENAGAMPSCWAVNDADGDSFNWRVESTGYAPHGGTYSVVSASWDNVALTPDNYLITPKFAINSADLNLHFWSAGQDVDYPAEHYSVMVSTTGTAPADFTEIFNETLSDTAYHQISLPLTSYNGQQIYIAFRHWNTTDMFNLKLDDISIDNVSSVGIKEVNTNLVSVFPNPANNRLYINAKNVNTVEIFNLTGARVANYGNQNTINISDLAQGTYLVKVITDNKVTTQKINIVR